jgi:hypothetical protein
MRLALAQHQQSQTQLLAQQLALLHMQQCHILRCLVLELLAAQQGL